MSTKTIMRVRECQLALLKVWVTLVALNGAWLCDLARAEQIETVAQVARRIDTRLQQMENMAADDTATALAQSFLTDLDLLKRQSIMVFGEREKRLQDASDNLRRGIASWSTEAVGNPTRRRIVLADMRRTWAEMKSQWPTEALEILPPLWSCPMHSELIESAAGTCPVCGMPLEPIYVTQPQLSTDPIIRAAIFPKTPLQVGRKADLRLHLLFNKDGRPVELSDLEEAHTRKIHLLIVDSSETDYHHEHPEPVGQGEYSFSFTPAREGIYRVWVDLKPVLTHIQQYSVTDIATAGAPSADPPGNEPENRHTEIDGYKFDLAFDRPVVREKETAAGTLHITGPDGGPCKRLEIVMGAFGHFVGFCEDFLTVLHVHPVQAATLTPESMGGPDLPFYFRSIEPGTVRLFTQVKIDGKDFFPRFVLKVQPLRDAAAE
ncbi:MAG TPA: heavy metal-binding domain-containing protein [Chthoniobacterales bacterium]|nr:heavy metal-binding domain-containing protein [Chthoniobacterales bacterium]